MSKFIDMANKKFGRLYVLNCAGRDTNGNALWKCLCDCGNIVIVDGCRLRKGNTKSCGCFNKEQSSKYNSTHKKSKTRLYKIWASMKNRCNNKNSKKYDYYGARGIKICPQWENFENFENWAIRNGYQDNLSIDRINVNGNYEPKNCRWATAKTQANNRRNNRRIYFNNKYFTVTQISEIFKIPYNIIIYNLNIGEKIENILKDHSKKKGIVNERRK